MQEYKVEVYEEKNVWRNLEGDLHRTDGPAVEYSEGYKAYWVEGQHHRTDGPAIEWSNGDKAYYVDGQLHRTDGPAVEYSNGYKAYYVEGIKMSEDEFNRRNGVKENKRSSLSIFLLDVALFNLFVIFSMIIFFKIFNNEYDMIKDTVLVISSFSICIITYFKGKQE